MRTTARFGTLLGVLVALALLGCEHADVSDVDGGRDASVDSAPGDGGRRCPRPCTAEGSYVCSPTGGGGYSCDPCWWQSGLVCAPGELCAESFSDGPCGPVPYDAGLTDAARDARAMDAGAEVDAAASD